MLHTDHDRALSSLDAFFHGLQSCPRIMADVAAPMRVFRAQIANQRSASLQLYDLEIQLIVGPEENRLWLDTCLRYVLDVATGKLAGDAILAAPEALELFDQAGISVPEWTSVLDWEKSLLGMLHD
jgi:hypothetical protein